MNDKDLTYDYNVDIKKDVTLLTSQNDDSQIKDIKSAKEDTISVDDDNQENNLQTNLENNANQPADTLLTHSFKLDNIGAQIIENAKENDEYKFKLDNFDGPLDLLLHLIKVAQIDIKEIFVSKITEQYMIYMQDIDSIDIEKAGNFISMAATLLEIKSKKLLPKPKVVEEFEDPEQVLLRQIEEYKLFKEASEKLMKIEDVNRLYKQPDDQVGEYKYILPDKLSIDLLTEAFYKILQKQTIKAQEITERKIVKDRFTVAQKIAQIKDDLIIKKRFKFSELFESDYSKSEIINTFLAVLELLKGQLISAKQESTFSDIEIIKKEERE